jgi:hypothetical protein
MRAVLKNSALLCQSKTATFKKKEKKEKRNEISSEASSKAEQEARMTKKN